MNRNSKNSMRRIASTIFLISLALANSVELKAQAGITAVPFLQIEPDSRSAGMGNANVAIADNASAIFWNPAGLAFQRGSQISITHSNWLPQFDAGLFYDYLVGKMYIEGIGTIGGHITYLNLGEQSQRDEIGNDLGNFKSYDFAIGASYGFDISKNFAIGTGARLIYSRLVPNGLLVAGQKQASAGTSVAFDLGMLYKSDSFLVGENKSSYSLGLNASNIGTAIQYTDDDQKDPLPTTLRAGFAYNMELDPEGYNSITLAGDVSKIMAKTKRETVYSGPNDTTGTTRNVVTPSVVALFTAWGSVVNGDDEILTLSDQLVLATGLEYWYDKKFALRMGYFYESPKNGAREFITFGAGLRYDIFGVDFSYIYTLEENHPLANTVRFSVLVNFK